MPNVNPKSISDRMEEVKRELALKCAQNPGFREDLKKDPIATIEKEYHLPPGSLGQLKVNIVEEAPGTIVVPIPSNMENVELTDDQLEAVAGGVAFGVTAAVLTGVVTLATAGVVAGGMAAGAGVERGW